MRARSFNTTIVLVLACGVLLACNGSSSADDDDTGGAGDTSAAGKSTSGGGTAGSSDGGADGGLGGSDEGTADAGEGAGGAEAECEVDASYMPEIDPEDFVEGVDNPYWPLPIGTTWVFDGAEYIEVTVTDMSKEVMGIPVVVVRDTVRDGGPDADIVEDTFDWYAQDVDGNVWYMGEDTKEYEAGVVVSTEGSWEAGVDGALPGIVMHATAPDAGEPYRQEYYACEAEDFAETVSTTEVISVPFGDFEDCIKTHEFTPLEPALNENKYYCAGVGLVLIEDVVSGESVELVDMMQP